MVLAEMQDVNRRYLERQDDKRPGVRNFRVIQRLYYGLARCRGADVGQSRSCGHAFPNRGHVPTGQNCDVGFKPQLQMGRVSQKCSAATGVARKSPTLADRRSV